MVFRITTENKNIVHTPYEDPSLEFLTINIEKTYEGSQEILSKKLGRIPDDDIIEIFIK